MSKRLLFILFLLQSSNTEVLQQVKGTFTMTVNLTTHGFSSVLADISVEDLVAARVNFAPVHGSVIVGITRADGNLAFDIKDVVTDDHEFAVFVVNLAFDFVPSPGSGDGDVLFEFSELLLGRFELAGGLVVGDGGDVAFDD